MSESITINHQKKARPAKVEPGVKLKGDAKMARIPIKIEPQSKAEKLRKPSWIRAKFPGGKEVLQLKEILRDAKLATVCEEASCPNLGECFTKGTATFMIMGEVCTRRCPFCDVAHGRPLALDADEPKNLAETVQSMRLKYVVVTSVDRDDLRDGGAQHFVDCIRETRASNPNTKIEVLVPDFRGRLEKALNILETCPSDVFNHNLETAPRLYKQSRPGSDYQHSLDLLKQHKQRMPDVPTKSGLMLGLGETNEEVLEVMRDLRAHDVDMLTLGQYLQPSDFHLPVTRYVTPQEFDWFKEQGEAMGFKHVASGPMVRSSYHADLQAEEALQ
jgi:lipoic acid synthetase